MAKTDHHLSTKTTIGCLMPALIPDLEHLFVVLNAAHTYYLTNEPFSRKGKAHRAQIRSASQSQWLTLPVLSEDKKKPIRHVRINQNINWPEAFMKVLQVNYGNSRFYDFYQPEIRADFEHAAGLTYLTDIIFYLNERISRYLEITSLLENRISRVSTAGFQEQLKTHHSNNEPLIQIEQRGSYYRKIDSCGYGLIREVDFEHPIYRQPWGDFFAGCSVLDLLFQYGPYSYQIIGKLQPDNSHKKSTGDA
ncbi:WbqC-like protein family protein [Cyclonatronum proteinivorum]|uniref:WbqC-like protein family protein n=1 Tax=Cyclonatronum proteinivorum TaxID=1457365 RepID=A0A345UH47_9BACT|nr:WbqC family protein [Cyclonatronum proteinivorum]AXI99798.1 WbqC-like protein family protein [Cyclonatronum proteinivorum]